MKRNEFPSRFKIVFIGFVSIFILVGHITSHVRSKLNEKLIHSIISVIDEKDIVGAINERWDDSDFPGIMESIDNNDVLLSILKNTSKVYINHPYTIFSFDIITGLKDPEVKFTISVVYMNKQISYLLSAYINNEHKGIIGESNELKDRLSIYENDFFNKYNRYNK